MKKQNRLSKHHRRCKSNGGSNERRNLSFVKGKNHKHWHALFGNLEAPSIAEEINRTWIDPDWQFIAVRKV